MKFVNGCLMGYLIIACVGILIVIAAFRPALTAGGW